MIVFTMPNRKSTESMPVGQDFLQQMKDHMDDPVEECDFAECDYSSIDFANLSPEQLRYYIYWRSELREGRMLKSAPGYIFLRVCELVNFPEDDVFEQLDLIEKEEGRPFTPNKFLMIRFDISVTQGKRLGDDYPLDNIRESVMKGMWLEPPISRIFHTRRFLGYPLEGTYYESEYEDDVPVLFNLSLKAVDEYLRMTVGKGILDIYGGTEKTSQIRVFDDLPYYGEKDFRITYRDATEDTMIKSFLVGMYKCCVNLVCKKNGEKGPSVPSLIGKNIRDIISGIQAKDYMNIPIDDPDKLLRVSPLRSSEGPGFLIVPKNKDFKYQMPPKFKDDILEYAGMKDRGPAPYVDAPCCNPEYRKLTKEQLDFYLYWRSEVRKGNHPTTHFGYMWLLLCELINDTVTDPRDIYDMLMDLFIAYEKDVIREKDYMWYRPGTESIIAKTCIEYAVVKGLPLPSDDMIPTYLTGTASVEGILSGGNQRLSRDCVKCLADAPKNMAGDIDDDVTAIFCSALFDINRNSKSANGIISYCRMRRKTVKIDVFNNLKFYNWPNNRKSQQPIDIYDFLANKNFKGECRELLKAVTKGVKNHRAGKKMSTDPVMVFGVNYTGLPEVIEWYYSASEDL